MGKFQKRGGKAQGGDKTKKVVTRIQSRKEMRKQARVEKKQKKEIFFKKKYGKITASEEAPKKPALSEKAKVKADAAITREQREEKKRKRAEKEQERARKKRLKRENEQEEKNIKRLEKQLGMKKKKSKEGKLPKSFNDDGLDFLLDACDADKLKMIQEGGGDESGDDELLNDGIEEESDVSDGVEDPPEDMVAEDEEDESEEEGEDMIESADSDDEGSDVDDSASPSEGEEEDGDSGKEREDIYGRTIDAKGNVIASGPRPATASGSIGGKYIPPALRAKMLGSQDERRKEELTKLQRKVKGLLNRLAANNMAGIAKEIEGLYGAHSRNDMSECLSRLFSDSLVSPVMTPERLIMEHALLVGVLHCNVGVEVGATMIQTMVKAFHAAYLNHSPQVDPQQESDKSLDNYLLIILHLYTFKVTNCDLVYDLLNLLVESFNAKDVELILLALKTSGFALRKDDPDKLKKLILSIQQKSISAEDLQKDSRTKFMLEVLSAIKNNNVKKLPNYDPEHQQFLLKNMKQWLRPGTACSPFKIHLEDLLKAEERGRWWIVGSAWTGKEDYDDPASKALSGSGSRGVLSTPDFTIEVLDLARKMRMNTDTRRNIFCTVISAEDYLDAFEKLVKLVVRTQKEREVAFVLIDCCMHEKRFNPYYAQLMVKLAAFDRKYRMAAQFALWDKIKAAHEVKKFQRENLAKFLCYLIKEEALSVACLKVIEFADLDKVYVAFLRSVLESLLLVEDSASCKKVFSALAGHSNLRTLREGLRLFMRHFMLKGKDAGAEREALEKRIELAESCFSSER